MTANGPQVICWGEILWDVFPDQSVIGGAPFNVAQRLQNSGVEAWMISTLGRDPLGEKVIQYMKHNGLSTRGIAIDDALPTGQVTVTLDHKGVAQYTIEDPAAWDEVQLRDDVLIFVKRVEVFVFGSLAMRHKANQVALEQIWPEQALKVFDVNLRPPHFDHDWIYAMLFKSDMIKMNQEEMEWLFSDELSSQALSIEEQCERLSKKYPDKIWCVTLGENGACLFDGNHWHRHAGYRVKVVDTVGSGDAFLATLIQSLIIEKNEPKAALARAVEIGSIVAAKAGANGLISPSDWSLLLERNGL